MGLVHVVVGVLADDDDFDGVEGGVARPGRALASGYAKGSGRGDVPGVDVCRRWEDFLAAFRFSGDEPLQLKELGLRDLVFQRAEPALVESVYLELEELLLLVGEFGHPGCFVELHGFCLRATGSAIGDRFGSTEERSYATAICCQERDGLRGFDSIRILFWLLCL